MMDDYQNGRSSRDRRLIMGIIGIVGILLIALGFLIRSAITDRMAWDLRIARSEITLRDIAARFLLVEREGSGPTRERLTRMEIRLNQIEQEQARLRARQDAFADRR